MSEDKRFSPACKANGCPLAATVVTHWHETEKKREARKPKWGVCEYHSTAPGHQWTATTRIIVQNIKVIRIYQAMANITDDRIKPMPGEKVSDWLVRSGQAIKRIVIPGQTSPQAVPPRDWSQLLSQLNQNQNRP